MKYKLMVKTHNKTGLKYLCKTETDDPYGYPGSGLYWKRHLKDHGKDISTEILYETNSKIDFKEKGLYYSTLWNIVESSEWANIRPEEGDGGNSVSGKTWVTNGTVDRYINKNQPIPEGWKRGRSTGAFVNKDMQKALSLRIDRKKAGESIKKAWQEGRFKRDHTKCGKKGDENPAKRIDVRAKIGAKNSKPITVRGISFPSIKVAAEHFNVPRNTIVRWSRNEGSC